MDIAIIGGGIGGLTLALALHQRGIACRVYESAPEVQELGVGITLLPHGMRELTALGLGEALAAQGIENRDSCFFNRFGQLIYSEPRGRAAGYPVPEVGIHRGRVHLTLWRAAVERLGAARVLTDHQCVGLDQSDRQRDAALPLDHDRRGARIRHRRHRHRLRRRELGGAPAVLPGRGALLRRHQYLARRHAREALPTGRSYVRIGSIQSGNLVIYPIVDDVDGEGRQLINWTAQVAQPGYERNDWNKPGRLEDFLPIFAGWTFDWLDVPDLLRRSDVIFEYPMVDRDPVDRWTFGRVTLLGDAAHPMYPRGSNGAAQAILDARTLADGLAAGGDPAGRARRLRGRALGADRPRRAHQPRAPAGLPHPPRGGAGGRRPVRRSRPLHHPRRARAALGGVQAHRRLRPRARDLAPAAGLLSSRTGADAGSRASRHR